MNQPNAKQQEFQKNMAIQRVAQAKKAIAVKIIKDKMSTVLMPTNDLSEEWKRAAYTAVLNSSPLSFQAKLTDFAAAVKKAKDMESCGWDGKLSLSEFQTLANGLEAVSPNVLLLDGDSYQGLVEETKSMVAVWEELINEINNTAMAEAEVEYNRQAQEKEITDDDKIVNALRSVKAEA